MLQGRCSLRAGSAAKRNQVEVDWYMNSFLIGKAKQTGVSVLPTLPTKSRRWSNYLHRQNSLCTYFTVYSRNTFYNFDFYSLVSTILQSSMDSVGGGIAGFTNIIALA